MYFKCMCALSSPCIELNILLGQPSIHTSWQILRSITAMQHILMLKPSKQFMNSRLNPRHQMLCICHRSSVHIQRKTSSIDIPTITELTSLTFNLSSNTYHDMALYIVIKTAVCHTMDISLSVACQALLSIGMRFFGVFLTLLQVSLVVPRLVLFRHKLIHPVGTEHQLLG